jgi:glucosamine kinase
MTRILAGADVGGTSTQVVVSDGDRVLGRAEGPGAAVRPGRALVSATTIAEVVRRALGAAGTLRCEVLVVGAAGAGREAEREELRQALRGEGFAGQVVVTTDIEVALAAAFGSGSGIVVSSGTGSIAVGRDESGRLHRAGGYGWQMGDEGSGYAIGRGALGAVGRAHDGRGPRTELTPRVLAAARCDGFDPLVRWATNATVTEIAALAPVVIDAATAGDTLAKGIIDYAARELSQLALHLLEYFVSPTPVAVAAAGGLLSPGRPLYPAVKTILTTEPRIRLLERAIDPAMGAVAMARDAGSSKQ